jgi:hypothetical protein
MKVFSVSTYVTTVIHLEYNNESYEITHREDSNSGLVPEWDIINEDGEEEVDVKVRIAIIEHCKKYLS